MATTSNVIILYGSEDQINKFHAPIASATVVAPGDLLLFTTSAVTLMASVAEETTFTGVALDVSASGDTEPMNVLRRGIVNIGVASATYTPGNALKYASGANGTAWTLTAATQGASAIMWSEEYKSSAVTTLNCSFDAFVAGGVTAGSGLWQRLDT